jgi:hypothetical protein
MEALTLAIVLVDRSSEARRIGCRAMGKVMSESGCLRAADFLRLRLLSKGHQL